MDRRTFITTSSAAAVGLASNPILTARAQGKQPRRTSAEGFWPNKARLVISLSMQFETGAQPERGASSPFPPLDPKYPDLPAQKWYDYGFKEGIPRMLDLWDRVGVKVTSHMVEQERAGYQASIDTIQRVTGTRPIGFNAFWLRGTPNTLGILQELGFIYHIDDISRDEPFTVTVNGKPFAVVPYTIRNNDIVRFDSPATTNAAYFRDLRDDFDLLYAEAAIRRRMMSISTHDRISGIPGRVKMLEEFIKYAQRQKGVVFMRKDEIAKWALSASNVPHEG